MRRLGAALAGLALLLCAGSLAWGAELVGQVTLGGVPVPGATVSVTQAERRATAITGQDGVYRVAGLSDGPCSVRVEMTGFVPEERSLTISGTPEPLTIALMLRSFDDIARDASTRRAEAAAPDAAPPSASAAAGMSERLSTPSTPAPAATASAAPSAVSTEPDAADGLLINGSVNNGAASPFAQAAAFGNNRSNRRSLYNGTFGAVFGNSALDARPFSFTAQRTPKPAYADMQVLATFGGPVQLPRITRNAATVFLGYQRVVDHQASAESALVPTPAEINGDFSQSRDAFGRPLTIVDPLTQAPFANNTIPGGRLDPAALALLSYYPRPNLTGDPRYNYQAPVLNATTQDSAQGRLFVNLNARNQITSTVSVQRANADRTSLFAFTDGSATSNVDATTIWSRRFSPFFTSRLRYQFTRTGAETSPHFARRVNVSEQAGIAGADQSADDWGPPTLSFASGLLALTDSPFTRTTSRAHGVQADGSWNRGRHAVSAGVSVRRNDVTALGQPNGRGTFSFTGSASGSDLADFLLGAPAAAAIVVGAGERRLNSRNYEAFLTDDMRVSPGLTLNAGVRWEYETPMTETRGRLSNLDVADNFSSVALVTPAAAGGALTGRSYGATLLRPDRAGIQPRVAVAWRPVAGSSLVIRAGYGIYRNTATYLPIALLMSRQPPFSTAVSVQSTSANPLTLQTGLTSTATATPVTFAVDPDFKVGDAQNWQVLAQRDLPASLTVSAAYLGSYGRHLMQETLPNTYPAGAANPCPSCPVGFAYLTSNGSSSRHAGQWQLRRRLRNGLTASAQYTLAKATDNAGAFTGAALSGAAIAQDWRDLAAERAPSNFDQRHQLTAQVQYTTGVGAKGGALLTGIRGALVKGWTVTSQITAGSGLPLTPVYLSPVTGTGVVGVVRAALTGVSPSPSDGRYLNPAAYSAPPPGQWGNAGRNSVTGPAQFSMSAGVTRSFPWGDRMTLDWRLDATNVLNRVTYAAINTIAGSPQFGLPTRANPMRKLQATIRLRF